MQVITTAQTTQKKMDSD